MQIIGKLNLLQKQYADDIRVQENGTKLIGSPSQIPPYALHYIFAPMPASVQQQLTASFVCQFPEELLRLYEYSNGFKLFLTTYEIAGHRIPREQLSVYGIPSGIPGIRKLEPSNICLNDVNKPSIIPRNWLQFGSFYRIDLQNGNLEQRLYFDVDNNSVFAVNTSAKECITSERWSGIDECLSDLFDRMNNPFEPQNVEWM